MTNWKSFKPSNQLFSFVPQKQTATVKAQLSQIDIRVSSGGMPEKYQFNLA